MYDLFRIFNKRVICSQVSRCLISPHTWVGVVHTSSTTTEETNQPCQYDHDQPCEEDNQCGDPKSCPPVDSSISVIECGFGPHENERECHPSYEYGYDKIDYPIEYAICLHLIYGKRFCRYYFLVSLFYLYHHWFIDIEPRATIY